jgi:hypothetical protein
MFDVEKNKTDYKIERIGRMLAYMEKGICSKELLEGCPELNEKIQETEKLRYRLNILKRVSFTLHLILQRH